MTTTAGWPGQQRMWLQSPSVPGILGPIVLVYWEVGRTSRFFVLESQPISGLFKSLPLPQESRTSSFFLPNLLGCRHVAVLWVTSVL